ncbi:MAG: FKBP-type peptidyl-prolyl cis-trans isomerase [Proteobacteria bacterium]|nr:FKBP-type peptidyl-prolyl cis-trans isomerase [Pseudomonadota bacterium]
MKKLLGALALGVTVLLGGCDSGAQKGDTVIINFAGYLDGQQFPGGTAENFPLKLGSGQFVAGFEDQLVGAVKGEERNVKITFPQNYVPGLSGKQVLFKVRIMDIVKAEKTPAPQPQPAQPTQPAK